MPPNAALSGRRASNASPPVRCSAEFGGKSSLVASENTLRFPGRLVKSLLGFELQMAGEKFERALGRLVRYLGVV